MKTQEVSLLINCLTNNEDSRQDLWIHYLSGNPVDTFTSHLRQVSNEYSDYEHIRNAIWDAFKNPPSDKFYEMLTSFTEFEQSIVCLLALGLTVVEISKYKGLSEVRLLQVITSIKKSKCWEDLYGLKNEIDGGREIRS